MYRTIYPCLELSKFTRILNTFQISSYEINRVLGLLRDAGELLYFKYVDMSFVILDPVWLHQYMDIFISSDVCTDGILYHNMMNSRLSIYSEEVNGIMWNLLQRMLVIFPLPDSDRISLIPSKFNEECDESYAKLVLLGF